MIGQIFVHDLEVSTNLLFGVGVVRHSAHPAARENHSVGENLRLRSFRRARAATFDSRDTRRISAMSIRLHVVELQERQLVLVERVSDIDEVFNELSADVWIRPACAPPRERRMRNINFVFNAGLFRQLDSGPLVSRLQTPDLMFLRAQSRRPDSGYRHR